MKPIDIVTHSDYVEISTGIRNVAYTKSGSYPEVYDALLHFYKQVKQSANEGVIHGFVVEKAQDFTPCDCDPMSDSWSCAEKTQTPVLNMTFMANRTIIITTNRWRIRYSRHGKNRRLCELLEALKHDIEEPYQSCFGYE